jgi:Spy/CpxP family protein refolding chaperone
VRVYCAWAEALRGKADFETSLANRKLFTASYNGWSPPCSRPIPKEDKVVRSKSILVLFLFLVPGILAQESQSPYSGQETRDIKALSAEEIQKLLTGQGMGFAKAAELNQYPGPKHVLELSGELELTEEQEARTTQIREDMSMEAVRLGNLVVAKERELDALFATAKIDESQLNTLVSEIAGLRGKLRVVHLRAHLQTKRVLTMHQIHLYDQLRGYGNSNLHEHQGKH